MIYRCHGEYIYNTKRNGLKNSHGYNYSIIRTNIFLLFFVLHSHMTRLCSYCFKNERRMTIISFSLLFLETLLDFLG